MSRPYFEDDDLTLHAGDATDVLRTIPDRSVHCVVTSPPYWGLRDYGTATWVGGDPTCPHPAVDVNTAPQPRCSCGARRTDRQHGLERDPQDYVTGLQAVFDEVKRVLVETGTLWLNLGDSYSAAPPGHTRDPMRASGLSSTSRAAAMRESVRAARVRRTEVVPRKNLVGMPWRVAFALQQDGWILRNAIIWHKPNAMPESVRDRLSNRYEFLFLLTRQQRYHFDLDAILEPLTRPEALDKGIVIGGANKGRQAGLGARARRRGHTVYGKYANSEPFAGRPPGESMKPTGSRHNAGHPRGKNPGDVWSISTRPLREAHFAAFPIDLPLRCIAAGCPENGVVLDPFSGAGTTALAARQLDRRYIGIDLNPAFHDIALRRLGLTSQNPGRAA